MSKYTPLWEFVQRNGNAILTLDFGKINDITGFTLDHSFLNYKEELTEYGYRVEKISLKNKTVTFIKNL